jgi:cellulose synthase (UDP-forming)
MTPFCDGGARPPSADQPFWFDLHPQSPKLTSIKGTPGHFTLMADGAPFYIKGVAYNASHEWFDATLPLSRTEFDADFSAIQAMGGNTIRRYGSTWSDRVILNSAAQHHLKVFYGFWFMQDVDYLDNTSKEEAYQREIESTVSRYRGHSAILGWSLGNEVWGLLKHHYAQPYLTEERHAHVLFVERMAERIKQLDPNHPIFSAQESAQIAGADSDYLRGAPALDGICVNAYYQRDIAGLAQTLSRIDPSRPYVVSEFGPDGYWEDSQNHYDKDAGLLEDTAYHKASLYADRWREFVKGNQGRNLGGMAYCWSDRYEGTATWFGLTDLDGRAKPAVAALKDAWKSSDPHLGGNFPYAGPKIRSVNYPVAPQWPHEPFLVKVHVDAQGDKDPQYLWTVTGPNFRTNAGWITKLDSGDSVSIELPSTPGWYRVQVKVVGKLGLDEANVPVLVKASDSNHSGSPLNFVENAPAPPH